jgi:hypothetical protein
MKISLALLALSATAVAGKQLPRMPGKALHVRGGKFLPAEPVATFGAAVSSVNAAMVALSPGKTCELYGLPKSDLTEWIVENAGHVLAGTATMMWLALNGMSVEKTIGFGIVPFLVVNAKNILNETPQKFGMPPAGQFLLAAISTTVAYSCFTGAEWAGNAIKFYVAWNLINGVFFAGAPETGLKAWGLTGCSASDLFMMENFGYFIISSATMVASLSIFEQGAFKSVAYSFVPMFFSIIKHNFLTDAVEKFGMVKGPQYFWLAIMATIIASCGFD